MALMLRQPPGRPMCFGAGFSILAAIPEKEVNMRKMTVPVASAVTASLLTAAVILVASNAAARMRRRVRRAVMRRIARRSRTCARGERFDNEGRDEWPYKGDKNPAW